MARYIGYLLRYDGADPFVYVPAGKPLGPAAIYLLDTGIRITHARLPRAEQIVNTTMTRILTSRLALPVPVRQAVSRAPLPEGHHRQVRLFTQRWLESVLKQ